MMESKNRMIHHNEFNVTRRGRDAETETRSDSVFKVQGEILDRLTVLIDKANAEVA